MALTQISTAGVKDDAVTAGKIPADAIGSSEIAANAVGSSELADNAVDTAAIANNAVTAGKLASGVQTTINNNADNRVITGSGTANTLEGEASLTYTGSVLNVNSPSLSTEAKILVKGNNTDNHDIITAYADTATRGSFAIRSGVGINPSFLVGTRGGSETLGLMTNGLERMRLDASGNVGIGMTPAAPLHVTGSTADTLRLTNGSNTSIYYKIGRNHLDGKLEFRGTQSGDECYSFGGVSGEKIRFQPAGGISFNGDTAAANALDDYEEGTWTPSFTSGVSGGSYSVQSGNYTKVGRLVMISCRIDGNGLSATADNLLIGGLPFTSVSSNTAGGMYFAFTDNFFSGSSGTNLALTIIVNNSATVCEVFDGDGTQQKGNDMSDVNRNIHLVGSYHAA